jgi:hypothetical protein
VPPLFPTGVVAREVCGSGAAAAVCGQLQRHELHQPRLWPEDVASDGGSIVQARLALLVAVVGGGVEWRHAVAVVRVVLAVGPDAERVLGGAIHFRAVLARQLENEKKTRGTSRDCCAFAVNFLVYDTDGSLPWVGCVAHRPRHNTHFLSA